MRLGGRLSLAWAVAFATPKGADRLVKAWSAALGSRSLVHRSGTVAVLLENVADERVSRLVSAAASAFR